jgi:hypothetical protein
MLMVARLVYCLVDKKVAKRVLNKVFYLVGSKVIQMVALKVS